MLALVPVLCAVAGALLYALASAGKPAELGRLIFACAFLAIMLRLASNVVRLF